MVGIYIEIIQLLNVTTIFTETLPNAKYENANL